MPEAEPSDEDLMARYARGEAAAFELLYRRHETRVWRYLARHLADRAVAQELMQEVWFAVAREARRYRSQARFTPWLFTIARNRLLNNRRGSRMLLNFDELVSDSQPLPAQLQSDPADGPVAAVQAREQGAAVHAALAQLPREQRDAFLLHVEGELTVQEIAAVTDSNFETVRSRLRYARDRLRELLGDCT